MSFLKDISGLTEFPRRIVSLIPSVTDSLFALGLGESVIGVTNYCQPPALAAKRLTVVGGPKSLDLGRIRALRPDLVIANREENSKSDIEELARDGPVWLTFPQTIAESLVDLWSLVHLASSERAFMLMRSLETSLEYAQRLDWDPAERRRVFVPIWRGVENGQPWWMTFNEQTYPADVLRACGAETCFSERKRRFPLEADLGLVEPEPPGERDIRYPCVGIDEILSADPQVILLPSEPYLFSHEDEYELRNSLSTTAAVRQGEVYSIDGRWLFWHGTFSGQAVNELIALLHRAG
jgi:ABC-type Fe3+-hydroxamate transport system substrate-binding protein